MNGAQNTYNLSKIVVVLAMFVSSLGFAKTLKYVCTENGLPLKEVPSADAKDVTVCASLNEIPVSQNSADYTTVVNSDTDEFGAEWFFIIWIQGDSEGSGWIQADRIQVVGVFGK